MLLWCARHCCVCGDKSGVHIEIAHIGDPEDNSFDNGIPVCYRCHGEIGGYNPTHPRGNKISREEIQATRNLIYDKYTEPYLAPLDYQISQKVDPWDTSPQPLLRKFPDVTFAIRNLSTYLTTTFHLKLLGYLNGKAEALFFGSDRLYSGKQIWNLNPARAVFGHFSITNPQLTIRLEGSDRLEIRVKMQQEDKLGRSHERLLDGFVYSKAGDFWYFEP